MMMLLPDYDVGSMAPQAPGLDYGGGAGPAPAAAPAVGLGGTGSPVPAVSSLEGGPTPLVLVLLAALILGALIFSRS